MLVSETSKQPFNNDAVWLDKKKKKKKKERNKQTNATHHEEIVERSVLVRPSENDEETAFQQRSRVARPG
jgi:hypothetical protein